MPLAVTLAATSSLGDFAQVFLSIILEAAPFILIGSLLSGAMEVFVPRGALARIMPRRTLPAVCLGAACGVVLPMCECGIMPVVRRLLRKGVPVSAAVAYMLAAPIVNPVVVASTYVAFRFQAQGGPSQVGLFMVFARTGLGFLLAVLTGLVVSRLGGKRPMIADAEGLESHDHDHALAPRSFGARVLSVLRHAAGDFLEILFFLCVGSALAAVVNVGLDRAVVRPFAEREILATGSMMGLAVLLNVCSEADAFVAASFRAFSLGSLLAFLVLGPMLDIKLLLMYTRLYRARMIVVICSCTIVMTLVGSLLVGRLAPEWRPPAPPAESVQEVPR